MSRTSCLAAFICLLSCTSTTKQMNPSGAQMWVTSADKKQLLDSTFVEFSSAQHTISTIEIDTAKGFQIMDGFGFALTGGSAMLLHRLDSIKRDEILRELFLTRNGIGVSYLRISMGSSDLDDRIFSYDDLPKGETDLPLKNFNLNSDRNHLIPILKEIVSINPTIKIMASPWSPPVWMKTNQLPKGGSLKPEYYEVYANYFVRYVQEMAKEGIVIDAITIQNEPENPNNTPSLLMTATEQADFVKMHLGPAFKKANIKAKIIIYDHNADHPEYQISVLNDSAANSFVDGSAFHLYLGDVSALSKVHDTHPQKNIYFTEQWTSGKGDFGGDLKWHTENLIIGASRNWSKIILEWNLAADKNFDPHTDDGGCTLCQGALTIDNEVTRNVSYYIIAHASKFVPAGSVRVQSTLSVELPNVAFVTPNGKKVLIVSNARSTFTTFSIKQNNKTVTTTLQPGDVATYIW